MWNIGCFVLLFLYQVLNGNQIQMIQETKKYCPNYFYLKGFGITEIGAPSEK